MSVRAQESCTGAVYVEFLIVVIPFLVVFLGLTQLALIFAAQILVEHSASKAVRAAIVVLPDDHEDADYDGVPLNQIGGGENGYDAYRSAPSKGRLSAIKKAARFVLAPVAPSPDSFVNDTLYGALSSNVDISNIMTALAWNNWATAVMLVDSHGDPQTVFKPTGNVTAEVTFLFKCNVPLASRLMCGGIEEIPSKRGKALGTNGSFVKTASKLGGWRVLALSASRTMPNQGR